MPKFGIAVMRFAIASAKLDIVTVNFIIATTKLDISARGKSSRRK